MSKKEQPVEESKEPTLAELLAASMVQDQTVRTERQEQAKLDAMEEFGLVESGKKAMPKKDTAELTAAQARIVELEAENADLRARMTPPPPPVPEVPAIPASNPFAKA